MPFGERFLCVLPRRTPFCTLIAAATSRGRRGMRREVAGKSRRSRREVAGKSQGHAPNKAQGSRRDMRREAAEKSQGSRREVAEKSQDSRRGVLSCCRTLILAHDHDIMLAWHQAPMISCSHYRGVIMILHFPSPTPSCPHAPSLLQSLTCKETLPHCLASRSLIVQVFAQALIHRKYRWIVAFGRRTGVAVRPHVP